MKKHGMTAGAAKVGTCSIQSVEKSPQGCEGWDTAASAAGPVLAAPDGRYLAAVNMTGSAMVVGTDPAGSILWRRTYPEFQVISSIQSDPAGGYVLAGILSSGGPHGQSDEDAQVMKIDAGGKAAWVETYSGGAMETDDSGHYWSYEDDGAHAILAISGGGYVLAGFAGAKRERERAAWVLRIDARGKVLWSRTCGGTEALSAAAAPGGGFVVAGYVVAEEGGTEDLWAARLDGQGNILWDKAYGEEGNDGALAILPAPGGGFIIAGYAGQEAGGKAEMRDGRVMKLDFEGNAEWDRRLGGDGLDSFSSIGAAAGGGYVAAGFTTSKGEGGMDAWVVRLDAKGGVETEKTYGSGGEDGARSIQVTPDGGSIFSGSAGGNAWLVKLDAKGGVQWDRVFIEKQDWAAAYVQNDAGGGYVAAGVVAAGPGSDDDAWVARIDSKGTVLWARTYDRGGSDGAFCVQPDRDGGYIVAGSTQSPLPEDPQIMQGDAWIIKLDPEGSVLWDQTYGGGGEDSAGAILALKGGGYIVAGSSASAGAGSGCSLCVYPDEGWVLRLDALGGVLWERTYDVFSKAYELDLAAGGGYVLAGYGDYEAPDGRTNRDAVIVKITAGGDIVWARGYYANGGIYKSEEFYSIQAVHEGGYIAAGYTASKGEGEPDAWVVRIDPEGKIIWDRISGGPGVDAAGSVQAVPGGGFIAAGCKEVGAGGEEGKWQKNLWVSRLDSKGRAKWEKSYGGMGEGEAYVMRVTPDGGFIIAGTGRTAAHPQGYDGPRDAWIAKFDSKGRFSWNLLYGGPLADCVINP